VAGYQSAALIHFRLGTSVAGEIWNEMVSASLPAFTKPVAYFWLGRAQHAAGEKEAALRSWQAATKADPPASGLRARLAGLDLPARADANCRWRADHGATRERELGVAEGWAGESWLCPKAS
jgi:hypothetical protein